MRGRFFACLFAALALAQSITPAFAENVDPDDSGAQYAWSENAGWVNAEPGGNGGNGMQVADFEVTGWLWAENAGWISLSCANTASCNASVFGLTNDGHGALGGYAWSENGGWINFAPVTGPVTVNPATGKLAGMAWGENVGWISFASVKTAWCQATPSVPVGGPTLRANRFGKDVELSQLGLAGGAAWHDVVRGSLGVLRSSGGDFTAAMLDCPGVQVTADTVVAPGTPQPISGDGYWYLVRSANCKGNGSFDSGSPRQAGSRDAEIAASALACP